MGWMIRLGLMMLFLLAVLGATLWIYFNSGFPEQTGSSAKQHSLAVPIGRPHWAAVKISLPDAITAARGKIEAPSTDRTAASI